MILLHISRQVVLEQDDVRVVDVSAVMMICKDKRCKTVRRRLHCERLR